MRIAVIGAGVAGLGAAWLLSRASDVEVVVYEREPRPGGHANTVDVPNAGKTLPVDTGFIVYNTANYPNLIALFDHLSVPTAPTSMSFAVSMDGGRYEYSGSGLRGLFGQPGNLFRPGHVRMVRDVFRFFREASELAGPIGAGRGGAGPSLGQWLSDRHYSQDFISYHILPMAAAIWSTPAQQVLDFPARSFARFFANHGLLQARGRPAWRTVAGGSREYVLRVVKAMSHVTFRVPARVTRVGRLDDGVTVITSDGSEDQFDACVLACHADETLAMLADDADPGEAEVLGKFRYTTNEAILHTDARQMPVRRSLWSSWNYLSKGDSSRLAVTYWMNSLQPLETETNWFVTLNSETQIPEAEVHSRHTYAHPIFDGPAIDAQAQLWGLQGQRRTWFCGSYFGFGFHEDALQSGLATAEDLIGQQRPWTRSGENDRLVLPDGWRPGAGASGLWRTASQRPKSRA